MLSILKSSDKFCQDSVNCHGPRDTFREIITAGSGLHVCVTQKEARGTHKHDIHIDKYQTVCKKQEDGKCSYAYIDKNFANHMKDVVPWWVGERFKDIKKLVD